MDILGDSPYDFVMSHEDYQLERLEGFVHRHLTLRILNIS
jgi:hypothetical protein